jgi:hypothetical protein
MGTEESLSATERAGVSTSWMWLATALSVVLVTGTAGVVLWQSSEDGEASDFPTGTFAAPNGNEAMDFNADGTCRWYSDGMGLELPCKYAVTGDRYTEIWFDWPEGPYFPATYCWAFDGENLTFALWGEDPNEARRPFYTQGLVKSGQFPLVSADRRIR